MLMPVRVLYVTFAECPTTNHIIYNVFILPFCQSFESSAVLSENN